MVHSCCAFGCSNRFAKYIGIGFFRFPRDPVRRKLWGIALKRKGFEPSDNHRVCGAHFQSGKPSLDPDDPDYVPNVFAFENSVRKRKKKSRKALKQDPKNVNNNEIQLEEESINSDLFSTCDSNIQESSELKKKVLKMKTEIEQQTMSDVIDEENKELLNTDTTESTCENVGEEEDDFLSLKLELYEAYTDISTLRKEKDVILNELSFLRAEKKKFEDSVSEKEIELSKLKNELQQAYNEVNALRSEKDALQKKVASSDVSNRILQDAKELFFYTGVHSTKDFHSILSLIYDVDTSVKLFPMATQLLIVLMKLKLNPLYLDLAFRFQTSRNTVQRICVKLIPCLEEKLELLVKSPVTNALKKTLPQCYKNTVFESLYFRILRYNKSEAKQSENEDADCESM